MSKLKLCVCFAALFLLIFPANISAELSSCNYEIIKVAFSNGYIQGLFVNPEIVKSLDGDIEKLKKLVQKASSEYMDIVVALNCTNCQKNNSENGLQVSNSNLRSYF